MPGRAFSHFPGLGADGVELGGMDEIDDGPYAEEDLPPQPRTITEVRGRCGLNPAFTVREIPNPMFKIVGSSESS